MDRKTFLRRGSTLILGSAVMNPFVTHRSTMANSGSSGDGKPEKLTLFLAGDVMTGRGIDQVLPYSVNPRLYERYTKNAKRYVQLAERKNGDIPEEVSYRYIWGEALGFLDEIDPDVRIINLETSVTTSDEYWPNKGIHYRMHPENTSVLTEANIDVCVLGNNHILDWGYEGLKETLDSLHESDLKTAGAGADKNSAREPAVLDRGTGRLLVFAYSSPSAGVPMSWKAEDDRPGVNVLSDLNPQMAEKVASDIRRYRQDGDRVILSMHWGSNWGYQIPNKQQKFAHEVIDTGTVDCIFGHSSHHPKGIEVYNSRPILYGCGDLINDYEGIGGHEQYRPDLRLMYFPKLAGSGELQSLLIVPMKMEQFQLRRPTDEAISWLADLLNRQCEQFGHTVERSPDGNLLLQWQ